MLIIIKSRHFHSSINHHEHLFHRTLITSYFRPVNIAKFLRTAFLKGTSRSSRLQIFFKIVVLKSSTNFSGKHLCWSLFLKNLQAESLHLHRKRLQHRCFPVKFAKFLRTSFLIEHLWWQLLYLRWLVLHFFKKALLNSYFATLLWRPNSFFFSTNRLMYKKSNSFVYKFLVNFSK